MSRKYIGVDLGAWYGDKTRIAVLKQKEADGKLHVIFIDREPMKAIDDPYERNKQLVKFLKSEAKDSAIIGIDAPFAVPSHLCNHIETGSNREPLYNPECTIIGELANQFIYDNSARFVYCKTGERVLAPAGDKIGKMTARMIQMVNEDKGDLNIIKTPHLDIQSEKLSTIEVYPRATLKILIKAKKDAKDEDVDIPSYKGENWKAKKDEMLCYLDPYIYVPTELHKQIETDDDYDAIICALTAYLVSHKDYGYEKPKEEDLDKFTNSFIYIPKNLKTH